MPATPYSLLSPDLIRAAKTFYFAEHLGGLFYQKFAAGVANANIKDAFAHFSGDEYSHAGFERAHSLWYEKEGRKMLRAGGK